VAARVLVVSEAALLALLASDAPFGVGWLIHLTPALVLGACIAATWRRPLAAGVSFVGLGLTATVFFHTYADPIVFLLVSAPPLVAGLLFLLGARARRLAAAAKPPTK